MELTDGLVTLRNWGTDDVRDLLTLADDPEIARWTTLPSPYTHADAREWVERAPASAFAVTDARDGRILGGVGVHDVGDGIGEVGYWIARGERGRGVATRGLVLVSRWGLTRSSASRASRSSPSRGTSDRTGSRSGRGSGARGCCARGARSRAGAATS